MVSDKVFVVGLPSDFRFISFSILFCDEPPRRSVQTSNETGFGSKSLTGFGVHITFLTLIGSSSVVLGCSSSAVLNLVGLLKALGWVNFVGLVRLDP